LAVLDLAVFLDTFELLIVAGRAIFLAVLSAVASIALASGVLAALFFAITWQQTGLAYGST
jgi:hypothetical protein